LTKVGKLEERLNGLDHHGTWDHGLTTAEANLVRELWIQLHWTPEEAKEYLACKERMEGIHVAAGGPYLGSEENREYMILSKRCTELMHDIRGKRVAATHAMRDRVWPELAPRAVRYWKLAEKPREQLTDAEAAELKDLLEYLNKLQGEALEAARGSLEAQLGKTSGVAQIKVQRDNTSMREPHEGVSRDAGTLGRKPTAKDLAEGWNRNAGVPG
jgi:hypothetical protein